MTDMKTLKMLSLLRDRGRATLTQLAKKLCIPISTTFDKLRACEGKEISRFTALLNFGALGLSARAFILLRASKEDKESLMKFLTTNQNVNTLLKINNGWDFLAEVVCADMKDLEGFLEMLGTEYALKTSQVHYIIDEIRREAFLSDFDMVENVFPKGCT